MTVPATKPERPRNAVDCRRCKGKPPRRNNPPCAPCGGKGWLTPAEVAALSRPRDEDDGGSAA